MVSFSSRAEVSLSGNAFAPFEHTYTCTLTNRMLFIDRLIYSSKLSETETTFNF